MDIDLLSVWFGGGGVESAEKLIENIIFHLPLISNLITFRNECVAMWLRLN